MATITLQDVSDSLVEDLKQEADSKGTTIEAIAIERLASWWQAGQEHEQRNEQLLARLRAGEALDGPLGQELRQYRVETGVWLTKARLSRELTEDRA